MGENRQGTETVYGICGWKKVTEESIFWEKNGVLCSIISGVSDKNLYKLI